MLKTGMQWKISMKTSNYLSQEQLNGESMPVRTEIEQINSSHFENVHIVCYGFPDFTSEEYIPNKYNYEDNVDGARDTTELNGIVIKLQTGGEIAIPYNTPRYVI